jgi:hypothetical protein
MIDLKRCLGAPLWGGWGGDDLPANLCLHPQGQRLPQELARYGTKAVHLAPGGVGRPGIVYIRVSFQTSFDSKQPKLVSALSQTKRLFWLFCFFYTETESFNVLIEPKQTEDQPKQFDMENILVFFSKKLGFWGVFRFVLVCFLVCLETVCFICITSIPNQRVSMFRLCRNKQKTTETIG